MSFFFLLLSDIGIVFQSEFENEILRLGETCEARSVELTVIRSELRRSSVAFSAMALAAQYWSERLKRTEGYSQQLKGQLQMAEKVILKAHNDIGMYRIHVTVEKLSCYIASGY